MSVKPRTWILWLLGAMWVVPLFSPQAVTLPDRAPLSTLWSNRLDFSDLVLPVPGSTEAALLPDVAEKPQVHLDLLKEDLKNGSLDRLGYLAPRLVEVMPDNAEAWALASIQLAAAGQSQAARQRCDQALKLAPRSPLVSYAAAMVLREEGKLTEAISACKIAIAADPTHPYPWNILGRIQWQQGEGTNALASFRHTLELNPRFTPGYYNAGAVARALGDYSLAHQLFTRALELNPKDTTAHYGLALVCEATGDLTRAIAELKTGLQPNAQHVLSLQKLADLQLSLGQLEEAIQTGQRLTDQNEASGWLIKADAFLQKRTWDMASQMLAKVPPTEPNGHYLQGFLHMAKANYPEAQQSMDQALKLDPNHFGAYAARASLQFYRGTKLDLSADLTNRWPPPLNRLLFYLSGSLRGARGDWSGSLRELQQAEQLVPGFSLAGMDLQSISADTSRDQIKTTLLGLLFYLKNMSDSALTTLEQATAKHPDNPLANYWMGAAYLKKGDRLRAAACFDRATQKAPKFFSALYAAGELKFISGKPQEAADYYRKAAAVKEDPGLSLRLGVFYDNTGKPDQAEIHYRNVLRLAPDFFAGYNQLAWHLVSRGKNLDEALSLALKANGLQPGNGSVLDTLGWIYHRKGNPDAALEHMKKAAAINPGDPVIQYHLGATYFALKNNKAAKEALAKSLELSDRSEVAAEVRSLLQQIH